MIVRTENELDFVLQQIDKTRAYSIDTETVDRSYPDIGLTGISIAWNTKDGAYIPVGHQEGIQLPKEIVLPKLKRCIESQKNTVAVMHNAKYDMSVLSLHGGIRFPETIFDTMVASWMLDTEGAHGLKPLAKKYLGIDVVELDDITPKEKDPRTGDVVYRTDLVPIDTMARYAIQDAINSLKLMEVFIPMLEHDGQMKVFCELEMPMVFILMDMEMTGIKLDTDMLRKHIKEAPKRLADLEQRMYAMRPNGKPFNANSAKQLNDILFKELKLKPIGEKGKSGLYSTKAEYMEVWAGQHKLPEMILEYRNLSKLMGTYLKGLATRVGPDGRIRTRFNQILTTGRLSSSKPNLQNIPKPDKDVFGLRDMFIAEDGYKLICADYSQIELRVLAHISKDPVFIAAFTEGIDLHSYAAKMLYNLKEDVSEIKEKYPDLRNVGKTFNFSMIYGAGRTRLASAAKVSEKQAGELKDKYLREFRGIGRYLEATHRKAEKLGYVTTIIGRRRHVPDAQLRGKTQKEHALKSVALRQAGNAPIQGSAADIISIAMRNLTRRFKKENLTHDDVRIVLQVHDELILECREDIVDDVAKIVKYEMENAVKLRVPLVADVGIGDRWSDAKD